LSTRLYPETPGFFPPFFFFGFDIVSPPLRWFFGTHRSNFTNCDLFSFSPYCGTSVSSILCPLPRPLDFRQPFLVNGTAIFSLPFSYPTLFFDVHKKFSSCEHHVPEPFLPFLKSAPARFSTPVVPISMSICSPTARALPGFFILVESLHS